VATAPWAVSRGAALGARAKGPWLYDRLFNPNQFPCGARFNSIQLGFIMDFSAHSIIWTILVGLVIGTIAKLLMPGNDPRACIMTILLGIAGALVGTWIGRIFAGENYVAGWIMSVVGAMLLLLLYRFLFRRRP